MYSFIILLFYTARSVYLTKATTCYDDGTFVKDDGFQDMILSAGIIDTKPGIARYTKCEAICKRYLDCVSYFYTAQTRECQLNSVFYTSTVGMAPSTGTVYYRKIIECRLVPPIVENADPLFDLNNIQRSLGTELSYSCHDGHVKKDSVQCMINSQWSTMRCVRVCQRPTILNATLVSDDSETYLEGDVLEFKCDERLIPENRVIKITCQSDGNWTYMRCIQIQSCQHLHQCNSSYQDGEYWIHTPAFDKTPVKIYCYNLNVFPMEYVSLSVPNIGHFPYLHNYHCDNDEVGAANSNEHPGATQYFKININVTTMAVNRFDYTFSKLLYGQGQFYGEANDCYTPHYNGIRSVCGPLGTFNIDLTDTGLYLDPELKFTLDGWNPWAQIVRSANNTKIDLLCGGWSGRCYINESMILTPFPNPEVSESIAVVPICIHPN